MEITGTDARHISKVLRMQAGSEIEIVSDDGSVALARIEELGAAGVRVCCVKKLAECHEPALKITLAQGLAKGEKMDFIVQKAVELGVCGIVPLLMEHSVARRRGEKAAQKAERWQRIACEAAKQSKRDIIPRVDRVQTLQDALAGHAAAGKLIAYECEKRMGLKQALRARPLPRELLLIIGPEGGISEGEVAQALAAGAVAVSLGRRILRVETAGLAALSAILYETGDLGDQLSV